MRGDGIGRSKRYRLLILGVVVLVLGGIGFIRARAFSTKSGADFHVVRLHGSAPNFDLSNLRDAHSRLTLADWRGRGLVVNFWASWCVPCRREMKAFEAVHRRNPDLGILGIASNDDRNAALAFARKVGITYPLAFDPEGATAQRFGAVGLPSTVFIDARGTLLERRLGEMTEKELQGRITELLAP